MATPSEKMNFKEAAKYVGVTRQKISKWVKDGKLDAIDNPVDERERLVSKVQLDVVKNQLRDLGVINENIIVAVAA